MNVVNALFGAISTRQKDGIIDPSLKLLESLPPSEAREIVNTELESLTGKDTMLMWAVWRLKTPVVVKLLELGANPHFINEIGSGVSTYWDIERMKEDRDVESLRRDETAACDIARILHNSGVNLARDGYDYSWGLVRKLKGEHGLLLLKVTLGDLGYLLMAPGGSYHSFPISLLNDIDILRKDTTIIPRAVDRAIAILESLVPKGIASVRVCPSNDGCCITWLHLGIFCEVDAFSIEIQFINTALGYKQFYPFTIAEAARLLNTRFSMD